MSTLPFFTCKRCACANNALQSAACHCGRTSSSACGSGSAPARTKAAISAVGSGMLLSLPRREEDAANDTAAPETGQGTRSIVDLGGADLSGDQHAGD